MRGFVRPRLDYRYSLIDIAIAIKNLRNSSDDVSFLMPYFPSKHIYYVNHARTGLRIALSSLKLEPRSKVGVVAFNCFTVFNAIREADLTPVFIDITYDFKMDLPDLRRKAEDLDALIVTHLFGIPTDVEAIRLMIPGIPIIEDCAHAFSSKCNGVFCGNTGDISIFSIGKGKLPSVGDGGYVVLNNLNYKIPVEESIVKLPRVSITTELFAIVKWTIFSILHSSIFYSILTKPVLKRIDKKADLGNKFSHHESRILNSSVSVLKRRIKRFDKEQREKTICANRIIADIDSVKLQYLQVTKDASPNYFMLPFLVNSEQRTILMKQTISNIEMGTHFGNSINWAGEFGYAIGTCPRCELIVSMIVTLPTYCNYTTGQIRGIAKIKSILV